MRNVLIVANQTIGGAELEAAVKGRAAGGPCEFHLLVPLPPTPASAIAVGLAAVEASATAIAEVPDQRELARERLAVGLEWLASLGVTARGEVAPTDVTSVVADVVARTGADEIIVSTLPSRLSRWLRQDLPRRIERHVDVPITVVTARHATPVT